MFRLDEFLAQKERENKLQRAREAGALLTESRRKIAGLKSCLKRLQAEKEDLLVSVGKLVLINGLNIRLNPDSLLSDEAREIIFSKQDGELKDKYRALLKVVNYIYDRKLDLTTAMTQADIAAERSRKLTGAVLWG